MGWLLVNWREMHEKKGIAVFRKSIYDACKRVRGDKN